MSIEPPFPAVSRPSNTTTIRCLVSDTQRAIALSSLAMGFRSSSYSSWVRLDLPLITAPVCGDDCTPQGSDWNSRAAGRAPAQSPGHTTGQLLPPEMLCSEPELANADWPCED